MRVQNICWSQLNICLEFLQQIRTELSCSSKYLHTVLKLHSHGNTCEHFNHSRCTFDTLVFKFKEFTWLFPFSCFPVLCILVCLSLSYLNISAVNMGAKGIRIDVYFHTRCNWQQKTKKKTKCHRAKEKHFVHKYTFYFALFALI